MTTKLTPLSKSSKSKISSKASPKRFPSHTALASLDISDKIILGISGGPDSVFLLHQLLNPTLLPLTSGLKSQQIILCHVNFNLRGQESLADQKFIENLAKQFDLKLATLITHPALQLKQNKHGNLEEICRDLRYDFFRKTLLKYKAKYILTGHHLNDQIETFLLNLSRGANLSGFAPLSEFDPQRNLVRPLLQLSKAEILKYLETHKIAYRLDQSNEDLKFSRNLIRHKIIPEFIKLNPNFLRTMEQSLNNFAENKLLIEQLCQGWFNQHLEQNSQQIYSFPLENFLLENLAMQKKLIAALYQKVNHQSLTTKQIQEIQTTLQKNRTGLKKEFGSQTEILIVKSPKTQKRQVVITTKIN